MRWSVVLEGRALKTRGDPGFGFLFYFVQIYTSCVKKITYIQKHGEARGGDYICVHWRRRDFVRSHGSDIPSINGTARQVTSNWPLPSKMYPCYKSS